MPYDTLKTHQFKSNFQKVSKEYELVRSYKKDKDKKN